MGVLESFGGMNAPIVAEAIIAKLETNIGYTTIFSISLGLFLLAVLSSMFLKRRKAQGKYQLNQVFSELKTNHNWKNIVFANFFLGLREGIFVFVITIWIFLVTSSELALGVFHLTLNGVSLIGYFLVIQFLQPIMRKHALLIGSVVISFSIIILTVHLSYVTLITYALVIGLAYPLFNVPYNSMTYDVIGKSKRAKDWRIEYVVIFEIFINLGRVLSVCMFIIVYLLFGDMAIRYLLLVISQSYLVIFYYLRKVLVKQ